MVNIIYDKENTLKRRDEAFEKKYKEDIKRFWAILIAFVIEASLSVSGGIVLKNNGTLVTVLDFVIYTTSVVLAIIISICYLKLTLDVEVYRYDKPDFNYYLLFIEHRDDTIISQELNNEFLEIRFKCEDGFIDRKKIDLSDMVTKAKNDIEEITVNFELNEIWIPQK